MNLKEAKIKNIKDMLEKLGRIYKKMKDSELKKDYKRLLYLIQSQQANFKLALEYIQKRIDMFGKSKNMMKGFDNKNLIMFWQNIKSIILDTYTLNKDIDRIINGR